jgi:DNA polymerase III delta subunit
MSVGMVSGSQTVLRLRWLRSYVQQSEKNGISVEWVDAENPGELESAIDGNPFMDEGKKLVVVENPHKGDLELYKAHQKATDADAMLLLHYDGDPKGNTKFGKWAKELGKAHGSFPKPSDWKAPEEAAEFAVEEAKLHGKTLEPNMAVALVRLVGADFGVVAFEILKMSVLADSRGSKVIGKDEIRDGRAELTQADVGPIIEALRRRQKQGLLKALTRIKERSKDDPTMYVARTVGAEALRWLQAASLDALPPKQAAQQLGINPWFFENKVLPVAKAWGVPRLTKLIKALAQAERGVFDGHISPWIGLNCLLLDSC